MLKNHRFSNYLGINLISTLFIQFFQFRNCNNKILKIVLYFSQFFLNRIFSIRKAKWNIFFSFLRKSKLCYSEFLTNKKLNSLATYLVEWKTKSLENYVLKRLIQLFWSDYFDNIVLTTCGESSSPHERQNCELWHGRKSTSKVQCTKASHVHW